MGACVVEVNGTEYYCPCEYIDDIAWIDESLVNVGSGTTITLYGELAEYNDTTSGYPRITLRFNTKGYWSRTYNGGSSALIVNDYKVIKAKTEDSVIYSILILGVLICLFLKR